jgi:hypothetical protein
MARRTRCHAGPFRVPFWAVLAAALGSACQLFVDIPEEATDGGTGASAGSTSTGGASGGQVGATAGSTGSSGSGTGATSAGGTGGNENECPPLFGPNPCDCDRDGHLAETCEGGDDCDDLDADVFTGQEGYFTAPRKQDGYDYNCDGDDEHQFDEITCLPVSCDTSAEGFVGTVPDCGDPGTWGSCSNDALCSQPTGSKTQGCR